MKLLNLNIGDRIVVFYLDKTNLKNEHIPKFICTCWPLSQVDIGNVCLNKYYSMINSIQVTPETNLFISKIDNSSVEEYASRISIKFIDSLSSPNSFIDNDEQMDTSMISGFIKEFYMNKCITKDQNLFITYLGQKLVFKIMDVNCEKLKKQKQKGTASNQDEICQKLEKSLILNDKKPGFTESNLQPVSLSSSKIISDQNDFINAIESQKSNLKLFLINSKTKIEMIKEIDPKLSEENKEESKLDRVTFKDIGGLEKEIELLKEFFVNPFHHTDLYKKIGEF